MEFDSSDASAGKGLGKEFVSSLAKIARNLKNLKVETTVKLPEVLECPWAVSPGGSLDPAIFVNYVRKNGGGSPDRVLWDYNFDISDSERTFYILSTIPTEFNVAVNGVFDGEDVASDFIQDIGKLGIAIGGEALKSGRNALGVVGLVGTIRLLMNSFTDENGPGFLIPVDSFTSFFGSNDQNRKRSDLLAVQLKLPSNGTTQLEIYVCGVESKFVSSIFSRTKARSALEQAKASFDDFRELVNLSLETGGMPERLGLLAILKFGLRISSPSERENIGIWTQKEQQIFEAILQGNYIFKDSKIKAVVVSTEKELPGLPPTPTPLGEGIWIRINKEHWPGVVGTDELNEIEDVLSNLFGISGNEARQTVMEGEPQFTDPEGNQITTKQDFREEEDKGGEQPIEIDEESGANKGSTIKDDIPSNDGRLGRILIGTDSSRRPVYLDPENPNSSLDNFSIMVTGSSGTGKTQLLKYLICSIRDQDKNVLIIDFKNDFAGDKIFKKRAALESKHVSIGGLPFNPLIPFVEENPDTNEKFIQIETHIAGLAGVFEKSFGLGDIQEVELKNAIRQAYLEKGIETEGMSDLDPNWNFPNMDLVGEILRESESKSGQQAYARLDEIFRLGLFKPEYSKDSFETLLNRSIIIDLSRLQNDSIKSTIAGLIVLSAHNYYNSKPPAANIRQTFIFDEAHRVLKQNIISKFVRECRQYGVMTIMSSQNPEDFPEEITGQFFTKILHGNGTSKKKVTKIADLIGLNKERNAEISSLERFQAFMDNKHHRQTFFHTMNYPLYLVYSFLKEGHELKLDEIPNIPGIEQGKLNVNYLVKQLQERGLAENKDGIIRLVDRDE